MLQDTLPPMLLLMLPDTVTLPVLNSTLKMNSATSSLDTPTSTPLSTNMVIPMEVLLEDINMLMPTVFCNRSPMLLMVLDSELSTLDCQLPQLFPKLNPLSKLPLQFLKENKFLTPLKLLLPRLSSKKPLMRLLPLVETGIKCYSHQFKTNKRF
uniref:Putative cuticle protein n=1 Tax=Lepeophtheirus salmonis TaxID=72036 RepID=A7TZ87_LEPSM|nr:putative cuticle protein [Lepeophtheirus salmonis]